MNTAWHNTHVLPKSASLEKRIAWHREHQKRCACRPIPPRLLEQMRRDPSIDEYLAGVNPKSRALLQRLRKTIHAAVPEVEECLSYRLPAFRYDGRIIAGFSATSTGCSYYPFSGTTLKTLASDIEGHSKTKGALHFDKLLLERAAEKWPGAHFIGIDLSPQMVAEARRKHTKDSRFRFKIGDAASLTLEPASVDVAFSTISFHHWGNQLGGVRQVARVLRRGGLFVLADIRPPWLLRPVTRRFHASGSRQRLFEDGGLTVVEERRPLRLGGHVLITVGRTAEGGPRGTGIG